MSIVEPTTLPTPPIMATYKRAAPLFVSGQGAELFDSHGRRYIDFLAGIAVVSVGHSNPEIAAVIAEQANRLQHVSNLFWNQPACDLAQQLSDSVAGWGRVFFCNSGAEANECAIKLARKWGNPAGKYKIIAALNSFHGRTLGALAATGQPGKKSAFQPLPEGFAFGEYNNLDSFAQLIDQETAAVILEPIQGEGGIIPASDDFLHGIRRLCSERGALLILDEIQTGIGRTGFLWAFQSSGLQPDLFTTAKGLGNGFPIGACIATPSVASSFEFGDHGSTFGGGPLACRVAGKVLELVNDQLMAQVREQGDWLINSLRRLPGVKEARGRGLMVGVELAKPVAREIAESALTQGLIVNAVRPEVLRITPPLVIGLDLLREGCEILADQLMIMN